MCKIDVERIKRNEDQVEGDQHAGVESMAFENLEIKFLANDVNLVVNSPTILENTTWMRAFGFIAYDGTKLKYDTYMEIADITKAHIK